MSNIIKTENLEPLYSHLEYLRSNGINETFITNFLDEFTIKDINGKPLNSYSLNSTKSFNPHYNTTNYSVNTSYDGFIKTITRYYNLFLKVINSYPNVTKII